ncbi:MAG: polyphosphate kinase 1 [Pleomorphochaeta sp.]
MKNLHIQGYTQNRELSWLKFNERVLEEGMDETVPLLERIKFISIFSSNLDEFFMIRVGSLFDMLECNDAVIDNRSGLSPSEQLDAIYKEVKRLYKIRENAYFQIESQLRVHNISNLSFDELIPNEQKYIKKYFDNNILPILSPQIVDSRHPFPHLSNATLHIGAMIELNNKELFSVIPVPRALPSHIFLPGSKVRYISIAKIILQFYEEVFSMYKVQDKTIFRVTRNGDINADDEAFEIENDFRKKMKKLLQKRKKLAAVRLEMSSEVDGSFIKFLTSKLNLTKKHVLYTSAPLDLSYTFSLEDHIELPSLRILTYKKFSPQITPEINLNSSLIKQIQKRDLLLSFPFQSMDPYLKLIKEASSHKYVISIKITIYRLATQAKLVEYLCIAAENGIDVTVLIELRARFDEQNNIDWSQRLEEAGCKVYYGFEGFKVHSKITLITLREKGNLSYITQIGTGNYNENTAKLYTDLSYFTSDTTLGNDATQFFKNMSISNLIGSYKQLLVSPVSFKPSILNLIDREIEKGVEGLIKIKINSMTDVDVIERLKLASCSGVKIKMIVRGICCLVPNVKDKTENIEIISIVGRYLEHSRIFIFGRDEDEKVYIGSADFMTRNTERRVEIVTPITNVKVKNQIKHIMDLSFSDNIKARKLNDEGNYYKIEKSGKDIDSQAQLMKEAIEESKKPVVNDDRYFQRLFKKFRKKFNQN